MSSSLGKAVWRLSSLMALPLAEILYHHTTQPPYLLPGRLVLLSISSLAPKCSSIICHVFSPAALTPGVLFKSILHLHILIFSTFLPFSQKFFYRSKDYPLTQTNSNTLCILLFRSHQETRQGPRGQGSSIPIRHTTPLEAWSSP